MRASMRGRRFHQPLQGQTIVIFALATTVLMGALGLALDIGYSLGQRRTMQNAADAAALTGTRAIFDNKPGGAPVYGAALNMAKASGYPDNATSLFRCVYVKNDASIAGTDDTDSLTTDGCAAPVPADATGIRVSVREEHPTFVMRVLGITTTATGATATAHILVPSEFVGGPFIVCGYETRLTNETGKVNGGTKSLIDHDADGYAQFDPDGQLKMNPAVNTIDPPVDTSGDWFVIQGPNSIPIADCKTPTGEGFKGINDQDANVNINTLPATIKYKTGDVASVKHIVNMVEACATSATTTGCYMVLPIVDACPDTVVSGGKCDNKTVRAVGWGLFLVKQVGGGASGNRHIAQLRAGGIAQTKGTLTYDPNKTYPLLTINLTR